tara:strand:- start:387 stop:920 length:534 start_codon:yes stop_codon:yes gene_type:complete
MAQSPPTSAIGLELEGAEQDFAAAAGAADAANDEMFAEMSPQGNFTTKGMNALVKSINRIHGIFEVEEEYPEFSEDATELPQEFMREITMVKAAADDAITAGKVDEEKRIQLDGIKDDTDLLMLAGAVNSLATDKGFKAFLKEAPPEGEAIETVEAPLPSLPQATEEQTDKLFLDRL